MSLFIPSSALLRTWLALCAESRPAGRLRCPSSGNVSVPGSHPRSPAGLGGVLRVHCAPIAVEMNCEVTSVGEKRVQVEVRVWFEGKEAAEL